MSGGKIGASVRKEQMKKFDGDLQPGNWKIITTFGLNLCTGYFCPSLIKYKISTRYGTTIVPSHNISDDHYLSFTSYDSILGGNLDKYVLLDVIGQVVSSSRIEEITSRNNFTRKKIEFEIRDSEDNRLSCTLWETYAEALNNAIHESSDGMVMCFLRFVKQNVYKERRYIENAFNSSILMINPQLPEMEAFQNILPSDGLAIIKNNAGDRRLYNPSNNNSPLNFSLHTISDVFAVSKVGKCRIACTISAIDTDWGWFYFSCRKCNKKVDKEEFTIKIESVKKPVKPRFWCETCDDWAISVEPKYKIHVHVWDNSGATKCLLFGNWASKIVGVSVDDLLDGSFDEIKDPNLLPEPIKAVCGKSFQFLIAIAPDNISGANDTYKVSNVWDGNNFIEIGNEESESTPNTLISSEQPSLMITNGSEPYETDNSSSSTPSSKRKTVMSNLPIVDQSSTSKKQCSDSTDDFIESKELLLKKNLSEVISKEDGDEVHE